MLMKAMKKLFYVFFATMMMGALAGCGGDDDGDPPAVDISGRWYYSLSNGEFGTADLRLDGSSVQGLTDNNEPIAGSMSGYYVGMTVITIDGTFDIDAEVDESNTVMIGSFDTSFGDDGSIQLRR